MHSFGFLDFDIVLKVIGAISGALVLVAFVAAIFYFYFTREKKTGDKNALDEWRERATVRAAKIAELEKERVELLAAVEKAERMYQQCEAHRAKDAQKILRLYGRLEKYEECINRLELKAGIDPITNFDEPFLHDDTDTGDRG